MHYNTKALHLRRVNYRSVDPHCAGELFLSSVFHTNWCSDSEEWVGLQMSTSGPLFPYFYLKGGFHETTKINKIDHRCIQIDHWVLETSWHRPMDTGAILAAD